MDMPADQRLLHDDLCAKLDQQQSADQLIRFMGGVLASLLRRKGDAEFLHLVQDAFTTGMAGRSWPEQQVLAREVIAMVIAKRPEVAMAWQRLHADEPNPYNRRAADAAADDLPEFSTTREDEAQEPFPAFLAALTDDMVGALERRLALFAIPETDRFPTPTYAHEQPYFLANPQFLAVARGFLANALLPLWHEPLEAIHARVAGLAPAEAVAETRPELWQLAMGRLAALADRQRSALAKLEAARNIDPNAPDYQLVEVPVRRERAVRVLGVKVSLGASTEMATRKVPLPKADKPSADEMLALDLAGRLHDLAADSGLHMPDAADLGLLHALLTFDAGRLAEELPGLKALAANGETEHQAMLDAIDAAVAGHPVAVADSLAISLFAQAVDGAFTYAELVALADRWGAGHSLLEAEIMRRPRDLAFQLRDALRRRIDRNRLGLAVVMLCEVWRVLSGSRRREALETALTVFSAFPIAFAGDADEAVFSDIGAVLAKRFAADTLDAAATIEQVLQRYGKVVQATGKRL